MKPDEPRTLARLERNDADPGNRRRIRTVLEFLSLGPGDRVLDCGCGLGWFLHVASVMEPGARLVGVDPEPSRVRRAAVIAHPHAMLVVGDGVQLPFPDAAFDKAVVSEVIEHVADDAGLLREVWRVLAPGGIAAITVPHQPYPFFWDPVNWLRERVGWAPIRTGPFGGIWTDHRRLYSADALETVAREAGFEVVETRALVGLSLPFAHNLVYGLGKPLVESGVLASADRTRYASSPRSALHPLSLVLALVSWIDRIDGVGPRRGEPAVSVAVHVRKPHDSRDAT